MNLPGQSQGDTAYQPRGFGPEATPEELAAELEKAVSAVEAQNAAEAVRLESLFNRLYGFFQDEQERQGHNRYQMSIDEDYFDGLQWDDAEIMALAERLQAPLVYNAIKPTCLWILGTEKRARSDGKVLARDSNPEADKDAENKTFVLKHLEDVNRAPFAASLAFKECIVSGLGWLEDGATNNPAEFPVYSGSESWKNILHDSCARDMMLKDGRYLFRFRDTDEDIALSMFALPWQHAAIKSACEGDMRNGRSDPEFYLNTRVDSTDYPNPARTGLGRRNFIDVTASLRTTRRRLRLIEAWYRVPQSCFVCRGEVFDGQTFDLKNQDMRAAYDQGAIALVNTTQMQMRVAFMTETKVLEDRPSPYKHNDFPFTPVWCYRRGRDNAPYGVVREQRDPQDSLNKHMSKSQWLMASNQIVAEDDATKDWRALRRQADKPNGTIRYKKGSKVEIVRHQAEASQHSELARFDLSMMRENYGPNTDNLGLQTNASSGVAINARQEQGTVQIQPIFDNFFFARMVRGQKRLSLIEQYLNDPKTIRKPGTERGKFDYLKINQPVPQPDGSHQYENDITRLQAEYVLDETDWKASIRQAMAETMASMIQKMPPEVAFKFMDMWVELVDLPNKEEYIARVRKLNGMGPDGDPAAQLQQAQQQLQQAQQQTQGMQAALDQAGKQAEAAKAEAQRLQQQSARVQAIADKQATLLANRAEELRLQALDIDNKHEEAMANVELLREKQDAANPAAAVQNRANANQAIASLSATHDAQIKTLHEFLANVEQSIVELRNAPKEPMQLVVPHGAIQVHNNMPAPAPAGARRRKITLSSGHTGTLEDLPAEPAAPANPMPTEIPPPAAAPTPPTPPIPPVKG